MSKKIRLRVVARFDSRPGEGTITIDRGHGVVSVRPKRRRRTFDLPLAWVAEAVYRHVIRLEVAQRRAERKAAKKQRRAA